MTGLAWLLAFLLTHQGSAFYLPGGFPRAYLDGENVEMDVNVMSSIHTHLPYKYYSLPFCRPPVTHKSEGETLGEILMGDRIERSPYEYFPMNTNVACRVLCTKKFSKTENELLMERIRDEYSVNLLLDNLPVSVPNADGKTFSMGVPIGARSATGVIVFNHLHFTVRYNEESNGKKHIVAFQARPYSVKHHNNSCGPAFDPQRISDRVLLPSQDEVVFSYGITWIKSTEKWATRWDVYLNAHDSDVHGWAVVNSLLIVFVLSGMVALVLLRTLRNDIARDDDIVSGESDDIHDETLWKLVAADVFRPPRAMPLLAAYAGTGVQILGMAMCVLFFATLGFLSPASRGALVTAMMMCFVFLGVQGGFTAARLMKTVGPPSWLATVLTATMVPGQIFAIFFVVNLFVWGAESSAAVPFGTFVVLILLWFFVNVPFVFIGSVLGYKAPALSLPLRPSNIARFIPDQPWYMKPIVTIPMGGSLPFAAVFIELFFILTSIWQNKYYYVFGCLFIVCIIMVVVCAEITIVLLYFQLCAEDYRWWWRSFLTAGSSGAYLFLYITFYFVYTLKMTRLVPTIIYFGYMGVVSYVFFVVAGTVGFLASFIFVRKIYGSIHIE